MTTPRILENGYRDFSDEDCEKLKQISLFRKLGLVLDEIKKVICNNNTSGYYDVFIPAMKKLSASCADYFKQLEIANEKLIEVYTEIEGFNTDL